MEPDLSTRNSEAARVHGAEHRPIAPVPRSASSKAAMKDWDRGVRRLPQVRGRLRLEARRRRARDVSGRARVRSRLRLRHESPVGASARLGGRGLRGCIRRVCAGAGNAARRRSPQGIDRRLLGAVRALRRRHRSRRDDVSLTEGSEDGPLPRAPHSPSGRCLLVQSVRRAPHKGRFPQKCPR